MWTWDVSVEVIHTAMVHRRIAPDWRSVGPYGPVEVWDIGGKRHTYLVVIDGIAGIVEATSLEAAACAAEQWHAGHN